MTKEEAINYLNNFRMVYADLAPERFLEALDCILSQPSLPSNLDEAAEDSWAVYEYRESPMGLYSTCYVDGFKAGAEWMAGQGETIECSMDWYDGPFLDFSEEQLYSAIVKAELEVGDKVVVQIRKK